MIMIMISSICIYSFFSGISQESQRMDKLVKSLKTTKRRLSQQFKVATGKSEITTDATYDLAFHQFSEVEGNLKMLGTQCVSLIQNVDTWCDTNRRLADELLRFTSKSDVGTTDMNTYKTAVTNLHNVLQGEYDYTRRAIICVLRAHILKRIEQLLDGEFAEVGKVVKTRKNIVTDYDSHRNKCSMYERKGDSVNADKFRMKMDHDYQMLQEHTAYLEKRFEELIAKGSAILSHETATLVACEIFLVERQNEAMKTISSSFGDESVKKVTQSIEDVVDRIKCGENVEMNYVAPEIAMPESTYIEPPVFRDFNMLDPKHTVSEHYSQPLPTPPPKPNRVVQALYSLDSAEAGELSFKEGDRIEVIREDPSGWWEGKLDGKMGRFPSNYTTAICSVSCNKHVSAIIPYSHYSHPTGRSFDPVPRLECHYCSSRTTQSFDYVRSPLPTKS